MVASVISVTYLQKHLMKRQQSTLPAVFGSALSDLTKQSDLLSKLYPLLLSCREFGGSFGSMEATSGSSAVPNLRSQ